MHQTILYMKKIAQYWHKRFDILLPQIFVHKLKFLTCQVRGWFVISQGVRLVTDQTLTGHKLDTWIFSAWMICCCHNLSAYSIVLLHSSQTSNSFGVQKIGFSLIWIKGHTSFFGNLRIND